MQSESDIPAGPIRGVKEAPDDGRRLRRVEDSVWNAVVPLHRNHLQQRMDVRPPRDGQQHIVGVLASIEDVHAVEIEFHDVDLGMMLPKVVPQCIHIMAPPTMH